MKVTNNRRSKIIRFLNGRTFYVVLCLSFVAIGVAMWSGIEVLKSKNNVNTPGQNDTVQNQSAPKDTVSIETPVESKPSDVQSKPQSPMPETEKKPSEEASATAKFFISPIVGQLIKGYSDEELQYSLTFKDMRLHTAVDIAGKYGDPITASGEGIVTKVYADAMLGTVVEIDHGNGITARYCGLNTEPAVKKGDKVDSSVQIGSLGDIPSESVEQVHLHLEFYQNGKSADPLKFFSSK